MVGGMPKVLLLLAKCAGGELRCVFLAARLPSPGALSCS